MLRKEAVLSGSCTFSVFANVWPDFLAPAQNVSGGKDVHLVSLPELGGTIGALWKLSGLPGSGLTLNGYPVSIAATTVPPDAVQPGGTKLRTGDARVTHAVWSDGTLHATAVTGCTPPGDTCDFDSVSATNSSIPTARRRDRRRT